MGTNIKSRKGTSIFERWLEKSTDKTLLVLKKLGLSLIILGILLFVFGLGSIILAIYSFSLKAPKNPYTIQICFYIFISLYLLVYVAIIVIGLFLIPAFKTSPKKIRRIISLVIYLSFLLIPSLALVVMGKWCIIIAKQSNCYQKSIPNNIQQEIEQQALGNIPYDMLAKEQINNSDD